MHAVLGVSLTATSAAWALVDTADGTIIADEVVVVDSPAEVANSAARSVQAFAQRTDCDFDGVRITWGEDASGHGIRLRSKLWLLDFDVASVSQEDAREARNQTARYVAPELVLAYGAARVDPHADDGWYGLRSMAARVPRQVGVVARVAAVAGVGLLVMADVSTSTAPETGTADSATPMEAAAAVSHDPASDPAPRPVAAAVPDPVAEPAPPAEAVSQPAAPMPQIVATEEIAVPEASTPAAGNSTVSSPVDSPAIATVDSTPASAGVSIGDSTVNSAEPEPVSVAVGEPHLSGVGPALGPAPAPDPPADSSAPLPPPPPGPLNIVFRVLP